MSYNTLKKCGIVKGQKLWCEYCGKFIIINSVKDFYKHNKNCSKEFFSEGKYTQ